MVDKLDRLQEAIRELQDLYDDPDIVTTADKLPPKENPYRDFMDRNPMAGGGRINFDGGGSPLQKFRQEIVESMKPYAPDDVTEDQLQLVVKDITLDMTAEQAQASALSNFRKLFGMADGGRIGFAPGKLVIKKPETDTASPDFKGQLKDKRKVRTSTLDDAIEVRNIIIKNKGHVSNVDELARLLGLTLPSGKLDFKKAQLALDLALDSFDELKGFKLAGDKYKNIDKTKFRYLDMIAKSFANHNLSTDAFEAAAHLLPSNMGKLVDLGDKIYLEDPKDPKKPKQVLKRGFFDVGERNITPAGKKFLVDRISTLTGQKFNLNQLNELILKTQKVRRLKGQEAAKLKKYVQMNQEIKNLANDNQIQNLLKGTLNRETQQALLERATNIVGGDVSIASKRLFQMAEAMSDTTNKYKDLGIKLNNTKASKIIATGRNIGGRNNRYAMSSVLYDYYGNVVDKALGATEGRTFIGKYQQQIKNLLDKGQSPDEIFSLTASARRGLSPYAIFTQNLRTEVNSAIKGAYIDSALSTKHEQLQEIFQGKKYNQLNAKEKKAANKLVKDFKKIKINALNQPINPGAVEKGAKPIYLTAAEKKNIQLPEFDLKNPPSKAIAGYKNFNPNLKSAFDKSYETVGYSMKVTPGMLTQKQLIKNLKTAKAGEAGFIDLGLFKDIGKGAGAVLKAVPTPAGTIGLTAGFGVDPTSAIDRASIAAEAAFAPALVQQAAKFNPAIQRVLNLGLSPQMALRAARIASPIGIASLGAEGLYQAGKFTRDRVRELQAMTPEQRQQLRAEQSALAFEGARDGGLIGKKSGPPPISGPTPHGDEGLPAAFKNVRKR